MRSASQPSVRSTRSVAEGPSTGRFKELLMIQFDNLIYLVKAYENLCEANGVASNSGPIFAELKLMFMQLVEQRVLQDNLDFHELVLDNAIQTLFTSFVDQLSQNLLANVEKNVSDLNELYLKIPQTASMDLEKTLQSMPNTLVSLNSENLQLATQFRYLKDFNSEEAEKTLYSFREQAAKLRARNRELNQRFYANFSSLI